MERNTIEQILAWLYIAATVIPIARVLQRTGFKTWWMLLMFVPVINLIALWIFAFRKWPIDKRKDVMN